MVVATKEYKCTCGLVTDEPKKFQSHLLEMSRKEKGAHKSVKAKNHGIPFIPFKQQKEAPNHIPEAVKTPLQALQDELESMKQKQADLATAIEKEAAEEARRKEEAEKKQVVAEAENILKGASVGWKAPAQLKKKSGIRSCIVIADNYWYEMKVDLKDMDTSDCEWGYYGAKFPVLVEKDGQLFPYLYSDTIGESATRLFKAANPEGFKECFRHRNGIMEKLKLGLMVALVLGIFMLIYILLNQKPIGAAEETVMAILGVM
jgi:hypothetical protein